MKSLLVVALWHRTMWGRNQAQIVGEITISQCYTVGLDGTNSRNGSEQCGVGSCWNMAGTEGKVRVQRTYQKYSGGVCATCAPHRSYVGEWLPPPLQGVLQVTAPYETLPSNDVNLSRLDILSTMQCIPSLVYTLVSLVHSKYMTAEAYHGCSHRSVSGSRGPVPGSSFADIPRHTVSNRRQWNNHRPGPATGGLHVYNAWVCHAPLA